MLETFDDFRIDQFFVLFDIGSRIFFSLFAIRLIVLFCVRKTYYEKDRLASWQELVRPDG